MEDVVDGEDWAPLGRPTAEEMIEIIASHPVGLTIGAFGRRPRELDFVNPIVTDFEWVLRPGPDPRPLCPRDLARVVRSIQNGGAVFLLGTDPAAVEIAASVIEAETRVGHA
jgi:hypothetical protein